MREPRKILDDILDDLDIDADADEIIDELAERGVVLAAASVPPPEPIGYVVRGGDGQVLTGHMADIEEAEDTAAFLNDRGRNTPYTLLALVPVPS